jgi:hypothetical protein
MVDVAKLNGFAFASYLVWWSQHNRRMFDHSEEPTSRVNGFEWLVLLWHRLRFLRVLISLRAFYSCIGGGLGIKSNILNDFYSNKFESSQNKHEKQV